MKVALLADLPWLSQELPTFRRLALGLIGEQIAVTRVVPQPWLGLEDDLPIAGRQIGYRSSQWQWLRDQRLRQTGQALLSIRPDVLHMMDGSLQRAGMALAATLGAPLVCGIWSREEAEALVPHPSPGAPAVYAASTAPLADLCRERLGPEARVHIVSPGVYSSAPEELRPALADPARSLSCLIVGDGAADEHYRALLEGMAAARAQMPQAMFFFYAVASDQHPLWQLAERLDLLDRISLVPYEPGSRQLMVQADVLIQPQPLGRVRSLVLEAMAAGRPVLAAEDPMLDYLIDGQTARIIARPTAESWAEALRRIADESRQLVDLGQRARRYVQERHTASAYIAQTREAYEQVAAPETIPFEPGGGR